MQIDELGNRDVIYSSSYSILRITLYAGVRSVRSIVMYVRLHVRMQGMQDVCVFVQQS